MKQYCRFCGSEDLKDIQVNIKNTTTNQFKPEVSYKQLGISGGSITKQKETGGKYISKFCLTCRNIDAVNIGTTRPLEAYSSRIDKIIIIPSTLTTHLSSICYEPDEISTLIKKISKCLLKIHNSWSIQGNNPCKEDRVGRKISFQLKHGVEVTCWVIVETIKNKIYLRLTYGGNKITCPET